MNKHLIKRAGYKHPMVTYFLDLLTDLEKCVGEQNVNICRYGSIKYHPPQQVITMKYDSWQGIARVTGKYDGWMQVFLVTIAEERVGELETLLGISSDPDKIEPDRISTSKIKFY